MVLREQPAVLDQTEKRPFRHDVLHKHAPFLGRRTKTSSPQTALKRLMLTTEQKKSFAKDGFIEAQFPSRQPS